MDRLNEYRDLIQRVLSEYGSIPYAHGEIDRQCVFDREGDHYLLLSLGWEGHRRVHGCLIHVDLIDGKFWIQRDGTERGVALDFVEAGIPKANIVLAFKSPERRQITEFAVS